LPNIGKKVPAISNEWANRRLELSGGRRDAQAAAPIADCRGERN
jgi:hypothetical protein